MYTLLGCIKHKCRDSYVLYIPTVYTPSSVWCYLHTLFWYRHTHMTFPPPVRDSLTKVLSSKVEFNDFEPGPKSAKKNSYYWAPRRLKSWNIEYNFKGNQRYFSCDSNLSRGSNSLNSASGHINIFLSVY